MTRARSLIGEQVDMGVAVGMAVLGLLSRNLRRNA
jgi:aspartate carbamoyltransferase catalytic subunit